MCCVGPRCDTPMPLIRCAAVIVRTWAMAPLVLAIMAACSPGRAQPRAELPVTVQTAFGQGNVDLVSAAFASDGSYVAVLDFWISQIQIWDLASGRALRSLKHSALFSHFGIVGTEIVSIHKDGRFRTWSPLTGQLLDEEIVFPMSDGNAVGIHAFAVDAERRLVA